MSNPFWKETQSPVSFSLLVGGRAQLSYCVFRQKWQASVAPLIYRSQHKCYLRDDSSWALTAESEGEDGWNLNLKCVSARRRGSLQQHTPSEDSRWRKVGLSLRVHTGLTVKWGAGVPDYHRERCVKGIFLFSRMVQVLRRACSDKPFYTDTHFPSAYSAMKKQREDSCLF